VFGVGGAGGNAVNNMITSHLEGVEFVVANTDAQALAQSLTERHIQLGTALTQGLGAGARPDVGRQAAEEALESIQDHLQGANMVFITCGMGGGTGTGAAPIMAQAARDAGILTVGVVTKPFHFEGKHRMRIAEAGIDELQQVVDTLIVIPNQNLFRIANENTTFADAFKMADDVLYSGVRGVTDLMVMPGLINLDFADVRSVMMEMGKAMMGTGEAEGEKRSLDAAEAAINNPLLDDVSLKGARGVLVNITGGPDMTLFEVDEACNHIRDQVDAEANIIFGSTFDEELAGRVRVSVVATGIDYSESAASALTGAERLSSGMSTPAGTTTQAMASTAKPAPAPASTFAPAQTAKRLFGLSASTQPAPTQPVAPAAPAPEPVQAALPEPMPEPVAVQAQAPIAQPSVAGETMLAEPPVAAAQAPGQPAFSGRRETDRAPVGIQDEGETLVATAPPPQVAVSEPASEPVAVAADPVAADMAARPRLFEWMKRSGRTPTAPAEPTLDAPAQATPAVARPVTEPVSQSVREPALSGMAATPSPAAPTLPAAADPGTPARSEDELLEIPAFLRRQSN
jgi:cell division protein FtsZ